MNKKEILILRSFESEVTLYLFSSLAVLLRPLLTWLVCETVDRARWMEHILRVLEEIYEIALPLSVHAALSSAEADGKEQPAKKAEFDASPAGQEAKKAEEEAERAVRAINPEVKVTICGQLPPGRWAAMTWVERLACLSDQTRSHVGLLDSGKSRDGAFGSERDSPPPTPRSVEEGREVQGTCRPLFAESMLSTPAGVVRRMDTSFADDSPAAKLAQVPRAPRSSREAFPKALARTRSFDDTVEESPPPRTLARKK